MRFNNERPIFLQIADHLMAQVISGELTPGARLASARELAASLEVNPNTAVRALQQLADWGIARTERGQGYFVEATGPDRARDAQRKEFFAEEVPRLFASMDRLGIDWSELETRWKERTR